MYAYAFTLAPTEPHRAGWAASPRGSDDGRAKAVYATSRVRKLLRHWGTLGKERVTP